MRPRDGISLHVNKEMSTHRSRPRDAGQGEDAERERGAHGGRSVCRTSCSRSVVRVTTHALAATRRVSPGAVPSARPAMSGVGSGRRSAERCEESASRERERGGEQGRGAARRGEWGAASPACGGCRRSQLHGPGSARRHDAGPAGRHTRACLARLAGRRACSRAEAGAGRRCAPACGHTRPARQMARCPRKKTGMGVLAWRARGRAQALVAMRARHRRSATPCMTMTMTIIHTVGLVAL